MKKYMVFLLITAGILVSCGQKKAESCQFTRNIERREHFRAAKTVDEKADLLYLYAHQDAVDIDDTKHYAADPHAYWLYKCMVCMDVYTSKPKELWAMYQALERCVDDYNHKLGRKHGSMELAFRAVEELYGGYSAGTQYEMNRGTDLHLLMDEIRLVGQYRYIVSCMQADGAGEGLDSWYGKEYKAWHRFMYLAGVLMYNHTFGMARYSAAPMEMNQIQEGWMEGRMEWLKLEGHCIMGYGTEKYRMDEAPKTDADLADIINFYYNCLPTAGWDDINSNWADNDDDVMRPYREDAENGGHPRLIAWHLKKAVKEWQAVRQDICGFLPEDSREEYQELTRGLQNFIHGILEGLVETYY